TRAGRERTLVRLWSHMGLSPFWTAPRSKRVHSLLVSLTVAEFRLCRKSRLRAASSSKNNHASDRFALAHQGEGLVNVVKRHGMSDHRVDFDPPLHVRVDDFRHIRTPACAAKSGAS